MNTLRLIWYDVYGYFQISKILRHHKKTVDFNKHGLRVDWVNRIYTVINPSPEDKGDPPDVLKIKAQYKIYPVHQYIEKIGLAYHMRVSAEQIPDPTPENPHRMSDSYLLVYYPLFRVLTLWRVFWAVVTIAGLIWAGLRYLPLLTA